MRLFVTGGTGFFCKAILHYINNTQAFLPPGFHVTLLTRSLSRAIETYASLISCPWLSIHEGDILDITSLPSNGNFTHIIHAAADSTYGPALTSIHRFDQIVTGTKNVLDYAVNIQASRFLYVSSGAVYGSQPAALKALYEEWDVAIDVQNPSNAYALGKISAEHLCHLYHDVYGVNVVIARCFSFVGPSLPLDVHFAIGNFIRDALWEPIITVKGDGSAVRTYMHQADLAEWLLTLMAHGQSGNTYNVGSDEEVNMSELAHLVQEIISPGKPINILGSTSISEARSRYVPDITKAAKAHSLKVRIPLAESIYQTSCSYSTLND
jgi:UDP-glucuronate decarboxylase